MARQSTVLIVLLTALCAATYLIIERPWRYSVVEPDVFQDQNLVDGLAHWKKSTSGLRINETQKYLCLGPGTPANIPFLVRSIPLSPKFDFVRISAGSKAVRLAPGNEPWQQGHILVRSFNGEGTWLWYWPSKLAVLAGNSPWADHRLTVPVHNTIRDMWLVVYNGGQSGEICLRSLHVEGLRERPMFTFMRYGLFVAWGSLLLWVGRAVLRARGSPFFKAIFLGVGLATLVMVVLPQPYYGRLVNPFEKSLSSVVVSSEAKGSPQADAGGPSAKQLLPESEVPSGPETERGFRIEVPEWILERISFEDIVHAGSFLLLAFFACLAYRHLSLPVLLLFLFATPPASEAVQFLLVTRSSEWRDLVADGIGVFIGVGAASLVRFGFSSRQRWPQSGPPAI
ncbi:MAG: hypothetical protein IIA72_15230 [Proteobacteria bacterium]|nr:hypothetical protein [Pseudomonadota bacterium]